MDGKLILWIIGLVIYFYIQSRKRKTEAAEEYPEQPSRPQPPVSFEDLLREIQASRKPEPTPAPPVQEPVVDYDDEQYREEEPVLEEQAMARKPDPVVTAYEASKTAAFNRASLEETMTLDQTEMSYTKFRGYDKEETPGYVQALAREFENRENLKKAFILKEILDRRF